MTTTTARTATRPETPARRTTPAPQQAVADLFVSRFRRLTAREVRVLVLVVKDKLRYQQIGDALGITRGNVANTMQSMRRKLAVPANMDLDAFIRSVPSLAALVEDDAAAAATFQARNERRRQDLLRITIDELQSVAVRARRRAAILEALPAGNDESEGRTHEASMARRVAQVVDRAVADVLCQARQRDLAPFETPIRLGQTGTASGPLT